ncbi:hypothetical protein [Spirosoma horti]
MKRVPEGVEHLNTYRKLRSKQEPLDADNLTRLIEQHPPMPNA